MIAHSHAIKALVVKPLVVSLLLAAAIACAPSASVPSVPRTPEEARWDAHAAATTIIRDNWGIAHVYGKTDADAVFGMLFAQAEDDFNRVEMNFVKSMGRMAEVEGLSALYTDLRMRLFIDADVVKKEYDSSPESLKTLMNAWADGLNYFLATHPLVKPKLLTRFEPWMALTFSEGSIGGDIESISEANLKAFYGGDAPPVIASREAGEANPDVEPRGSNGIAIAPARTANGNALLLINPHTSFYFRPEIHVVSDQGLNAYGAVTWGQFFVYQGFNESNGWMHTSSGADVMDYYAETIVRKDATYSYKYGSEMRPLEERKIVLSYKDGAGLAKKEFTVYLSHHGPIVRAQAGKWVAVKLMVEHQKALMQSFERTKARGYDEYKKTMDLRANSSNNTIYADASGNIGYYHGNFMPRRDPKFDWSSVVDGSNPATEWKGLHEVDETVLVKNPSVGWIQNCNSTPFTVSGESSPKPSDYPAYMAPDRENARGLHAVRVLKDKKDFTIESLIEAAYDSYLTGFEATLPALLKAYDELPASDPLKASLKEPVEALRGWDLRFSVSSVPTTVAVYWGQELAKKARAGEDRRAEPTAKQRLDALQVAVQTLAADFGTWKTAWGEVNRFQRVTGDIVQPFDDAKPSVPVGFTSGNWGSLASFGAQTYRGTKKMYGTSGNSFVAVVEFGKRLRAKSSLAGGVSGDPTSKHFSDQAQMYSQGQFKDVLFYREDVEKHAEATYHPGGKVDAAR